MAESGNKPSSTRKTTKSSRRLNYLIQGVNDSHFGESLEFNAPVTNTCYLKSARSKKTSKKESKNEPNDSMKNGDQQSNQRCETEASKSSNDKPKLATRLNFRQVTIQDSSGIHIGNKVFFNAPVVVKQYSEVPCQRKTTNVVTSRNVTPDKPPVETKCSEERGPVTFDERLVKRGEWFALPSHGDVPPLEKIPVDYVVIAHTCGPHFLVKTATMSALRGIQYNCFIKGMTDVCFNFVVGGEGHIYECRGWEKRGVFSDLIESKSICIGFMGDYMLELPPQRMIDAAFCLIEEGVRTGKIHPEYKLLAHKQVQDTESPGKAFIEVVKKWPHWSPIP